jgi:hypothetical protein
MPKPHYLRFVAALALVGVGSEGCVGGDAGTCTPGAPGTSCGAADGAYLDAGGGSPCQYPAVCSVCDPTGRWQCLSCQCADAGDGGGCAVVQQPCAIGGPQLPPELAIAAA